ncbi:hypothetical protein [Sphingopyxis chilensis]
MRASGFNGSRERRSLHASGFRFGFAFALRKGENYRGRVSLVRAFILVCVCLALFVQSAAQAASAPPETREAIHCSEMDDGMATERSSDKKPCDRMTLGCLVAMGCIALMAMPDTAPGEFAVLPFLHAPSVEGNSAGLHNKPAPPESPPPQPDRIL